MVRNHYQGLLALAALVALCACGREPPPAAPVTAQPVPRIAKPSRADDAEGWRNYMGEVADPQAQGPVKPFKFVVPTGKDAAASDQRKQIEDTLGGMAAHNAFPGIEIAVGGPDPTMTADLMVAAFGKAKPASLTKLTVHYIGDQANRSRVEKVVAASGAAFRFTSM